MHDPGEPPVQPEPYEPPAVEDLPEGEIATAPGQVHQITLVDGT